MFYSWIMKYIMSHFGHTLFSGLILAIYKQLTAFYIYAFSRRFYPKQLTVYSGYNMCFVSTNKQPIC